MQAETDPRMQCLEPTERWWGMMPFRGGLVITPDSLSTYLRKADRDDFAKTLENANQHGARLLASLFPHWANALARGA